MNWRAIWAVLVPVVVGAQPAAAWREWNPPAEYDKPFGGTMYVYRHAPEHVPGECRKLFELAGLDIFVWPTQTGCAAFRGETCIVIIRDRTVQDITPEAILRHERGHCNGWPADHPN